MHRVFFTGLSVLMTTAVFIGFSRSYYLKGVFGTPPLPTLFHIHGFLFTSWMVLLIVQTGLVATRRTPVHRQLGVAGGVLAALMTVTAIAMTRDLARRSAQSVEGLAFVIVPFMTVIVFPVLVGAALYYRRKPEIHKRLMLLATLELVTAGVGRIPGAGSMPLFFVLTDLGLVAMIGYDLVTRHRPHAATVWGGLLLIASQVARTMFIGSPAWLAIARMIAG